MPEYDPRERYDDLVLAKSKDLLTQKKFEAYYGSTENKEGWAVGGLVFDEQTRILLVVNHWADGWIVPSGSLEPNETLQEAVIREVKEEGGIEIEPIRPRGVFEHIHVNEKSKDQFKNILVLFEARAVTTKISESLGENDYEIYKAKWFKKLPDHLYNESFTKRVINNCEVSHQLF